MEGEKKGQRFELPPSGQVTLGRAQDNVFVVDGLAVSSHHGMVVIAGDVFTYLDVGSTNGSFVNDEQIHEARLYRGDVVLLGTTPVMIDGEDVPERPPDESAGEMIESGPGDIRVRTRAMGSAPRPAGFSALKSYNAQWIAFVVLLGLAVVGALAYFFYVRANSGT